MKVKTDSIIVIMLTFTIAILTSCGYYGYFCLHKKEYLIMFCNSLMILCMCLPITYLYIKSDFVVDNQNELDDN